MDEDPSPHNRLLLSLMEMREAVGQNEVTIAAVKKAHPDLPGDVVGILDGCVFIMSEMSKVILMLNEQVFDYKDKLEGDEHV